MNLKDYQDAIDIHEQIINLKALGLIINDEAFASEFLNDVNVVVTFNEDPIYSQVKDFFEEYGFWFMVPGQNLIIIDGEILVGEPDAKDILKLIEAHEVAHILFNHDGPRNPQDEIDADLGAYTLLKNKGWSITK